MGLVAVGSSVGGTIIPIAAHNLMPIVGLVSTSPSEWHYANLIT